MLMRIRASGASYLRRANLEAVVLLLGAREEVVSIFVAYLCVVLRLLITSSAVWAVVPLRLRVPSVSVFV